MSNINSDRAVFFFFSKIFSSRLYYETYYFSRNHNSFLSRMKSPSCGNKKKTDKPDSEIIIVSNNIAGLCTFFEREENGNGFEERKE